MPPPTPPITSEADGLTNPAAGVMATRPATSPETKPRMVGRRRRIHSATTQAKAAAAAAMVVVTKARAAVCPAASALPALKPNQPNHKKPPPGTVIGRLFG